MRWMIGGPDLPVELLQTLEEGKLVFFCGAGVSYPVGLPGFGGLVNEVYKNLNETKSRLEQKECCKGLFDRTLGLLENRIGKDRVRKAIIKNLQIAPDANLRTHRSLLDLSTTRAGTRRLVTTNFDRGFLVCEAGSTVDIAPKLPVPKLETWNSVVHLHGLIGDHDPEGRSLVLTSADFGSAYLTEGWASRFITDLFRRFTVLFVGYSVEDPVVRYMMDAFAADRALGEGVGTAYVLAGDGPGEEDKWKARGVIPLLYDSSNRHQALHDSLSKWAQCHRLGLVGRENVVIERGSQNRPARPFEDDPIVTQVLWAVSESSGHVARVFANLEPLPSLEWLPVFEEKGILRLQSGERPAHLVDSHGTTNRAGLHPVTRSLGEWLSRHIGNPIS